MSDLQPVAAELSYYRDPDHRIHSVAVLLGLCAAIVGGVALLADIGALAETFIQIGNGSLQFYRQQPIFFIQFMAGFGLGLLLYAALLLAGLMALARRSSAWTFAVAYLWISIGSTGVSLVLTVVRSLSFQPSATNALGAASLCARLLAFALVMIVALVILRRSAVKREFLDAITRPARPAGMG